METYVLWSLETCGSTVLSQASAYGHSQLKHQKLRVHSRVSYRGGGGGGPEISPPQPQFSLPRNLEIEYGYYISYLHVSERMCHQNVWKFCPRLRQKQSERHINSKFSWGGACLQNPLVGIHAFRTLLSSYYHPVFPPQLKILYEALHSYTKEVLEWSKYLHASAHPWCKVSCQGVPNRPASSLRPCFVNANLTVENALSR